MEPPSALPFYPIPQPPPVFSETSSELVVSACIYISAAAGAVAGLVFKFWANHTISKGVAPVYAVLREKDKILTEIVENIL